MARRSKKLNIVKKYKGDQLYSEEFNEVVNTINDLVDDVEENSSHDNETVTELTSYISEITSYINDLNADVNNIGSYVDNINSYVDNINSYVDNISSYMNNIVSPSIDELLARSSELLGLTNSNKNSIDALLEQSATLLGVSQNHETRITSAEELLAASQQLLNEINGRTAYDIPSTNGNVQQDIDTLLAQSAALLGVIETTKSESYNYTNIKYDNMKEYVDNSYNKMYSYVEDTTLTFTIEGIRENTFV